VRRVLVLAAIVAAGCSESPRPTPPVTGTSTSIQKSTTTPSTKPVFKEPEPEIR
jgi:hypothetical protein